MASKIQIPHFFFFFSCVFKLVTPIKNVKGWIIPLVLIQSHSIEVYITSYKRNIVQSVTFRWHILRVCRTLYYHELECVNWTGTDLPISNTVRSLCAIHKTFLKML